MLTASKVSIGYEFVFGEGLPSPCAEVQQSAIAADKIDLERTRVVIIYLLFI